MKTSSKRITLTLLSMITITITIISFFYFRARDIVVDNGIWPSEVNSEFDGKNHPAIILHYSGPYYIDLINSSISVFKSTCANYNNPEKLGFLYPTKHNVGGKLIFFLNDSYIHKNGYGKLKKGDCVFLRTGEGFDIFKYKSNIVTLH